MTVAWTAENAAHLLRRATFGARPKDVEKAQWLGESQATVDNIFLGYPVQDLGFIV